MVIFLRNMIENFIEGKKNKKKRRGRKDRSSLGITKIGRASRKSNKKDQNKKRKKKFKKKFKAINKKIERIKDFGIFSIYHSDWILNRSINMKPGIGSLDNNNNDHSRHDNLTSNSLLENDYLDLLMLKKSFELL